MAQLSFLPLLAIVLAVSFFGAAFGQAPSGHWAGSYEIKTGGQDNIALSFAAGSTVVLIRVAGESRQMTISGVDKTTTPWRMRWTEDGTTYNIGWTSNTTEGTLVILHTTTDQDYPTSLDLTDATCTDTCTLYTLDKQDATMNPALVGVWAGAEGTTPVLYRFIAPSTFTSVEGSNYDVYTRSDVQPAQITMIYFDVDELQQDEAWIGIWEVAGETLTLETTTSITRPTSFGTPSTTKKQDSPADQGLAAIWIGSVEEQDGSAAAMWKISQGTLVTPNGETAAYETRKSEDPSWLSLAYQDGDNAGSLGFHVYQFSGADNYRLTIGLNQVGSATRPDINATCTGCVQHLLEKQLSGLPTDHEINGIWKNEEQKLTINFRPTPTGTTAVITIFNDNGGNTGNYQMYLGMVTTGSFTWVNEENGEIYLGLYQIELGEEGEKPQMHIAWNQNGEGYRPITTDQNTANCDTCDFFTLTLTERHADENDDSASSSLGVSLGVSAVALLSTRLF